MSHDWYALPRLCHRHPGSGDTVILDNLNAHKVAGVREAIEAGGARVLYLPPYSLDFNPVEQVFAKVKASSGRRQRGPPPT